MFLVYDTKEKYIGSYEPFGIQCSRCKKLNVVSYKVYQKYFTLFWIPFIPLKKIVRERCSSCNAEVKAVSPKGMINPDIAEAKRIVKTKWYFFTGAGLVTLFALYVTNALIQDNVQSKSYLKDPRVGDAYEMRDSIANYNYYVKVIAVSEDSISILKSSVSFSDFDKKRANAETAFLQGELSFIARKDLLYLFKKDHISRVHRKENN